MNVKKDYKKLTQEIDKNKGKSKFNEDKEKRLIRLIRLMIDADKGVLNQDKEAKKCGVSKRTIQRDIQVLIAAGLPLYKENDANSNYRIMDGWKLFHYNVDDTNALALLRSYRALSYFYKNPTELLSPVQKEILKEASVKYYKNGCSIAPKENERSLSQEEFVSFLSLIDTTKLEVQERILRFLAGDMYFRKNPHISIKIYERLISLNDRGEYYWWLGSNYCSIGNYEKAKECFLKTIEKDPYNSFGYISLADIYRKENNWTEVFNWMEKGLKIMPNKIALNVHMVSLLMENGKYEEAKKYIPFISGNKHREYAWYADIYEKSGNYKEALEYINKAVKAEPKLSNYVITKRRILAKIKRQEHNKNIKSKPAPAQEQ